MDVSNESRFAIVFVFSFVTIALNGLIIFLSSFDLCGSLLWVYYACCSVSIVSLYLVCMISPSLLCKCSSCSFHNYKMHESAPHMLF